MAHHLGRAKLTSALPPDGSGKTPFGARRERSVGLFLIADYWGFAVPSQEIPFTSLFLVPFRREPIYRVFSRVLRTFITVMRRCHSSVSIHRDKRVNSIPLFQLGMNPFIGHPSFNWEDVLLQSSLHFVTYSSGFYNLHDPKAVR